MKSCPFCLNNDILTGDILYETDLWYYVTSIDPILDIGGMIITKRHIKTPFDINREEWQELKDIIDEVKLILNEHKPDGYNMGWNIGAGGQNVEHAHLHFFARFKSEPLAGKGMRYAFKQPENKRIEK